MRLPLATPAILLAAVIAAVISVPALPVSALPAAAEWRDAAHPYDIERIDGLAAAVAAGDAEAAGMGTAYEQAVAVGLMGVRAGPVDTAAILGDWRCRTIKVGGPFVGLVVYDWFACRISGLTRDMPPSRLYVEKTSGSQRFAGRAYPDGPGRLVLLAGGFYHYESQRPYGAADSARGPSPDNRDKVAVIEQLGPDWLRAVFPYPARESTYDVVEFRRAD